MHFISEPCTCTRSTNKCYSDVKSNYKVTGYDVQAYLIVMEGRGQRRTKVHGIQSDDQRHECLGVIGGEWGGDD
jgi:hypothetical protein